MSTRRKATIEDLYRNEGKAELVDGELVLMSPIGGKPGRAGGNIFLSLRVYEKKAGGRAYPDNVGFKVRLPHRESFSPDVAFHTGQPPGMGFVEGAPVFAVESATRETTARRRRKPSGKSAPITLPRGRSWSGTSTS